MAARRSIAVLMQYGYGVFLLVMCCLPTSVAALRCQDSGGDMHVRFPTVISIPAGVTPGSVLGEFVQASDIQQWACHGGATEISMVLRSLLPPHAGQSVHVNGKQYAVFPTNLPYIGVLAELTLSLETAKHGVHEVVVPVTQAVQSFGQLAVGHPVSASDVVTFRINAIRLALVYTGGQQLASGTVSGGVLGQMGVTVARAGNALPQLAHTIHYSAVRLISPTCMVQDVTVTMPPQHIHSNKMHANSMWTGQWQPFAVQIHHCPPGMRHVHYRLVRPRYGLLDETQQIMRGAPVSQPSSAQGIGIQIAADTLSGTVIHYGTDYAVTVSGAHRSDLQVPLKARYAKPAGMQATAGRIDAAVTFEMSYE